MTTHFDPDTRGERPDGQESPSSAAAESLSNPRSSEPTDQTAGSAEPDLPDGLDVDAFDEPDEVNLVDAEVYRPSAGPKPDRSQRDVIPEWLRDGATRRAAVAWLAGLVRHWVLFHLVRSPVYLARLCRRAPAGLVRVAKAIWAWAKDAESTEARRALVHSVASDPRSADALYRLRERHRETVRFRVAAIVAGPPMVLVVLLIVWLLLPTVVQLVVVAGTPLAVLIGLGVAGRAADRPLTDRAVASAAAPRLTSELIVAALGSLGLGKMNTAMRNGDGALRFVAPITRSGPGWRADIDLPIGVTAGEIIDRRGPLASGLRRPLGCVWPEVDPDAHEGRLVLYVADQPLSATKPTPWPLAERGTANVFDPVPVGVDQRNRPVTVTLMFASGVVGAIPRMGKTFLLRLICLAGALDPRVEIHAYNLKGGADLDALEHVAYAYRAGDEPEDIAYALADLRAQVEDMRRRYRTLRGLPKDICPESKVTNELASRRDLGLHPVLIPVDECQVWFEHPEHGKEFVALCTDLVKRGPAVGIMAYFATQRPDAASLPPGIRDNAVLRFCLKVTGQPANDMVLGTGMYKAGYRATTFSRKDLGIAMLAGETTDPVIVRTAYIDNQEAEAISVRARALRKANGWLTGLAAGAEPDPDTDTASILDHLLHIWPAGEDKVWCETLAERLAEQLPGTYDAWTGEQVTTAVKPHGIETVQVKRRKQNRRGIALDDLTAALARRPDPRQHRRPGGPDAWATDTPSNDEGSGAGSGGGIPPGPNHPTPEPEPDGDPDPDPQPEPG